MKTTLVGGQRGYDAGKAVKDRKRHIIVDTLGLLPAHRHPFGPMATVDQKLLLTDREFCADEVSIGAELGTK